ncbi:PTS glucitol/sorbitol transporter subunit IIA [Salinicoccus carnicancri]|uniref:PTS glucitol/sorbitol transporter subunit IIA n=1 Tax=Salinicoccus carnicancri TaxID=558170 RepID=UPI00030249A5|nr:PTS glucitol/sorbitol transporter subunit IIA [Salinicoccus carnicancri]
MEKLNATISELGNEWEMMKSENMVILFNEDSPQELRDISVVHDGAVSEIVEAGDVMELGDESYDILFVGGKANETLRELGHATFQFNGQSDSDLPGTICLEKKEIPSLEIGQKVIIKSN